jgi:hypothetical protein
MSELATCTQYYIHFKCGHDVDSEFGKCATHYGKEGMCNPKARTEQIFLHTGVLSALM